MGGAHPLKLEKRVSIESGGCHPIFHAVAQFIMAKPGHPRYSEHWESVLSRAFSAYGDVWD
jgi:hypothetical protein